MSQRRKGVAVGERQYNLGKGIGNTILNRKHGINIYTCLNEGGIWTGREANASNQIINFLINYSSQSR